MRTTPYKNMYYINKHYTRKDVSIEERGF